jgi:hypothetical protein
MDLNLTFTQHEAKREALIRWCGITKLKLVQKIRRKNSKYIQILTPPWCKARYLVCAGALSKSELSYLEDTTDRCCVTDPS